ncbi:peptidylprolyl isomerase B, partial [Butyriboletus roseoflavus]
MFARISLAFIIVSIATFFCAQSADATKGPKITHKAYFDIKHGDKEMGRGESRTVPKTVENFRALATGQDETGTELCYGYKGSKFHHVIKTSCKSLSNSSYAYSLVTLMKDSLIHVLLKRSLSKLKHTGPGMLSMANSRQGHKWYVVFGKVLEGMDIVYAIGMFFYLRPPRPITLTRRAEVVPKGGNDRPLEDVVIYDSGELPVESVVDEQGHQDLEDEPTVAETSPAAAVEVVPITPTDAAPATSAETLPVEETAHFSPPYLRYASIVFLVMTVPCVMYICGGLRLILLRRLFRKRRAGSYNRVSVDDDVEK